MSVASLTQKIDDLTRKAAEALADKRYFEAERLASEALDLAREDDDFARMVAVLPTLEETRLGRLDQAVEPGTITIVDSPFDDDVEIKPGCYLFQPPLVGADARRFRLSALERSIPVGVLCREPLVKIGLMPIVALGSGATVRTKVKPPQDLEHPDIAWFLDALDALGEAATEIDPDMEVGRRITTLIAHLSAIPEHEGLHRCLEQACLEAAESLSADDKASGPKR